VGRGTSAGEPRGDRHRPAAHPFSRYTACVLDGAAMVLTAENAAGSVSEVHVAD